MQEIEVRVLSGRKEENIVSFPGLGIELPVSFLSFDHLHIVFFPCMDLYCCFSLNIVFVNCR